jgi:hypothetical protein
MVLASYYTHRILDLFLMTLLVLVLSSWIVFVYPRYIYITDYLGANDTTEYVLIGWNLMYLHVLVHIVPFVAIVAVGYRPEKTLTWKTWFTIAIFGVFICFSNTQRLYGIDKSQLLVLGILTIIFLQIFK